MRRVSNVAYKGPLAVQQKCTMKYAAGFSLDPSSAGSAATHVFSANGLYDPDITSAGHQPMGFDQIQAFYDHWVVIGSKITVWFGQRNSNAYDQIISIHVKDTSAVDTNVQTILERPLCIDKMISAGNSGNSEKIVMTLNPNTFLGRSKPLADDQLKGSVSSNPAEQCYFHVCTAPIQSVDASAIDCYAVLEYTAVFIEPKNINGS